MIANERQSKITRRQLTQLRASLDGLVRGKTEAQMRSDALLAAEAAALSSQIESLTARSPASPLLHPGRAISLVENELPRWEQPSGRSPIARRSGAVISFIW